MRRALASAVLLSAVVALSAAQADTTPTAIKITSWKVVGSEGSTTVEPGTTYRHCPSNIVTKIVAIGRMSHPGKKGVKYSGAWFRKEEHVVTRDYRTGKHGKVYAALVGGGAPVQDGKWQVKLIRQGAPVGQSSLKLASGGPAC
jgi:hypothetical protein